MSPVLILAKTLKDSELETSRWMKRQYEQKFSEDISDTGIASSSVEVFYVHFHIYECTCTT